MRHNQAHAAQQKSPSFDDFVGERESVRVAAGTVGQLSDLLTLWCQDAADVSLSDRLTFAREWPRQSRARRERR